MTNDFIGNAQEVAQVTTLTVGGTPANGQVYTAMMGTKTVSYTAGSSDTNSTIAAGLQADLAASSVGEFLDAVYTVGGNVVTATATNPGVPFTLTGSATGTGTLTAATTTASAGPGDWTSPGNWSLGYPPAGALSAPTGPAASLQSGGSLTVSQAYYYVVTAFNPNGETTKSAEVTVTPTSGNQTAHLSWTQGTATSGGGCGYKIYRGTSPGGENLLVGTVSGLSTTTFNDTGFAGTSATPPAGNTATGDDVYLSGQVALRYGLAQGACVVNSFNPTGGQTADVGLPNVNATGGYYEYRPTYLSLGFAGGTINVGQGAGGGSGRLKINHGAGQVTVNVYGTAQPATDPNNLPSLCLQGGNAANALNLYQGYVGLAVEPGQACQYGEVRVGYETSQADDVHLTAGPGATLGQIDANGGTGLVLASGGFTTHNQYAGEWTLQGTGGATNVNLYGGSFEYESTGTLQNVFLGAATLDLSQDLRPKAIGSLTVGAKGFTLSDPEKTLAGPLALTFAKGVGPEDGALSLGKGVTLTRS